MYAHSFWQMAYYFSQKMVRLVLLLAAPAAVLAGWGSVFLFGWGLRQFFGAEKVCTLAGGRAHQCQRPILKDCYLHRHLGARMLPHFVI
jgi:hypothetical protein